MIKSIDTYYDKNFFRSRLEARWAVFFNEIGVKYEYEPEGFKNETGECYLPDFYLPNTYLRNYTKGVYIEIKPDSYEDEDIPAAKWFEKNLILFRGTPDINIWGGWDRDGGNVEGGFELGKDTWDNCMYFWICGNCSTSKIEFAEGNYNDCPVCKSRGCDEGKLIEGANIATMTRFEHKK